MQPLPGVIHVVAADGTTLAAHVTPGEARDRPPLLCLPGGPMLDSDYLGTLGGLDGSPTLVLLDPRGTGASGIPADPATYRCDRQVGDVEAVRRHLGADRVDVLAHSAGANLAYRYLEQHADRVDRLVLVTPSVRALDVPISDQARSAVARSRAGEPWYPAAAAALLRVQAGSEDDDDWDAVTPFTYGRWDAETRRYDERMESRRLPGPAQAFGAGGAFDPPATRAAAARFDRPVLVLAGGCDTGNPPEAMSEVAALFPRGALVVQAGAGHFPWIDDPVAFSAAVRRFLGGA